MQIMQQFDRHAPESAASAGCLTGQHEMIHTSPTQDAPPAGASTNDSPAGGQTLLQSRPSLPAGDSRKQIAEPLVELEPPVDVTETSGLVGVGGVAEMGQAHPTLTSRSIMYGTPLWLFRELDLEFHFEVDVCAVPELALCKKFYTPEVDGLLQEWEGVCWMNPPYGKGIERWVAKALESSRRGATVVCLLPARVDTAWFHDFVWKNAELRFLRGRLTFRGFAGRATAHGLQAPFPCVIAIFRGKRTVSDYEKMLQNHRLANGPYHPLVLDIPTGGGGAERKTETVETDRKTTAAGDAPKCGAEEFGSASANEGRLTGCPSPVDRQQD